MSSYTSISPDKLSRLIGTAKTPALIDVRTDEDFAADPRLIPGAIRRNHQAAEDWGVAILRPSSSWSARAARNSAQGTAAWLRQLGVAAEVARRRFRGLEGGKTAAGSGIEAAGARRARAAPSG